MLGIKLGTQYMHSRHCATELDPSHPTLSILLLRLHHVIYGLSANSPGLLSPSQLQKLPTLSVVVPSLSVPFISPQTQLCLRLQFLLCC